MCQRSLVGSSFLCDIHSRKLLKEIGQSVKPARSDPGGMVMEDEYIMRMAIVSPASQMDLDHALWEVRGELQRLVRTVSVVSSAL